MKSYIRENLKLILSITLLVFLTVVLIGSNEILAQTLPDVSRYHITKFELEKKRTEYSYTGEDITPKVTKVVIEDEHGNPIVMKKEHISKVQYKDNIKVGMADLQISFVGYNGFLEVNNAFSILPSKVQNLRTKEVTGKTITIEWDKVDESNGYLVYKSVDEGKNFELVGIVEDKKTTTFQDEEMIVNTKFQYYVSAYTELHYRHYIGAQSKKMEQMTPLETPTITSASSVAHNKITLKWKQVEGAVGYQIFRGASEKGEFTLIGEVKDGATTTYTDGKCKCGSTYYYYVKACQQIEEEKVYGEASPVAKEQAKPASVKLTGSTTGGTAVNLSWKASDNVQGYELYRSDGYGSSYKLVFKAEKADTLSWSESGLQKGTNYTYRIRPYTVIDGKTIYGNYSNTYQKAAVIDYNYTPGGSLDVLKQYAGVKYVYGGTSPVSGWDCSGFVQWVYKNYFGMTIGRSTSAQYNGGTPISVSDRSAWKPGDLLLYRSNHGKGPIGHVALYLGGGEIIHAIIPKTTVHNVDRYETMDYNTLVAVRRYLP